MANNVRETNELKSPSEPGVHYRLLCMTGPNKGKAYYLIGNRIIIGRANNVDIQIVDNKISREHTELVLVENQFVVSDLNTQNGTLINDQKIKQKAIKNNEKLVIGQNVFKFNIFDNNNDLVVADELVANPGKKAKGKKAKLKAVAVEENNDQESYSSNQPKKNPKFLILIIGLALVGYVMFGDDNKKGKPAVKPGNGDDFFDVESETKNKTSIQQEDPEIKRKFEQLIHSGRREFREGNYFRAMEEFRRAQLLIPGNGQAAFLQSRAKQRLDEDVKKNFNKANRDLEAKKLQAAAVSYCAVIQLLQNYPEHEDYKAAQSKIEAIELDTGRQKGEIKCFETKPIDSKN